MVDRIRVPHTARTHDHVPVRPSLRASHVPVKGRSHEVRDWDTYRRNLQSGIYRALPNLGCSRRGGILILSEDADCVEARALRENRSV